MKMIYYNYFLLFDIKPPWLFQQMQLFSLIICFAKFTDPEKKPKQVLFFFRKSLYFLLHKTSIKTIVLKSYSYHSRNTRVGNPERPSKVQNSSAKVSLNSRKTFAVEKKTCLGFGVRSHSWRHGYPADILQISALRTAGSRGS